MRTAEQWTALYEDGTSPLNDPPRHITDIFREVQREAFDAGASAMRDLLKDVLMARLDMRSFASFFNVKSYEIPNRP